MGEVVVSLDGYLGGWVAVSLNDGCFLSAVLFKRFRQAVEAFCNAAVIAVDIPIGCPLQYPRKADLEARLFVGPRRFAVVLTPPREILEARTYKEALTPSRSILGKGIPQQTYALREKILEVDGELSSNRRTRDSRPQIVEVHPEVSFRALNGAPLVHKKTTWAGVLQRRRLLERAGLFIPDEIGKAGKAAPHDVLDAAVAAWSALRVARGEAKSFPGKSRLEGQDRPIAIWY
jgi:predicted RNase H-like nuclease